MLKDIKKFSLPDIEERVLDFWRNNKIFEKAEDKNKKGEEFVFYEGPPTANGKPAIHHVLSRAFKDIVLRFQTMKGKKVLRRGGWDTHGLPVELEIEKNLGLNSKTEIEEYGIAKFNKKCKESVWKYKDEWESLTDRMGYWLDMDYPYITYENSYIETLWWIVKEIDKKGLLYKGHKVVPWCTRCGTGLSSHELAQGYETVTDRSVIAKFRLKEGQDIDGWNVPKNTFVLSWTTTPWTLPGNVALAVGDDIDYVVAEKNGENIILAKDLLEDVFTEEDYNIMEEVKGKELVGLEYEPLFKVEEFQSSDKTYKIYSADFVTTEEGTGVVHTAVMYGEDDYTMGKKIGLPQFHTVNESGKFVNGINGLEDMYVKSKNTEDKIFNILEDNNNLFKTDDYDHEYPHCWRCNTPVLYYARDSWFIEVTKIKDKLIKENETINWIPDHIKNGRFGEWLQGIKDWAISRERYWGTPLPVWQCDNCEDTDVIGSFKELNDKVSKAKNSYIFARHGEAEHNVKNITNSNPKNKNDSELTDKGLEQVKRLAESLKGKGIDIIYSSDFLRTKQTADIIAKDLGIDVVFDERLREINVGDFDGRPSEDYHKYFKKTFEKFTKPAPSGESLRDVSKRVWSFFSEMESMHKDKNILVISHDYITWMADTVSKGWSEEKAAYEKDSRDGDGHYTKNAEFDELLPFVGLPRNDYGLVDPHRPYADKVDFSCEKCGGKMKRVEEVMDVWFDSGAMPFAQMNFPFSQVSEDKQGISAGEVDELIDKIPYPAEYIVEGIDQTRGWFYTLLATSSLLDKGAPYKNAISLGLILDKEGKKMSKSRGNVVDPWDVADNYGLDIVRWYFYTNSSPGEPIRFDEEEIKKTIRGFLLTAYNSFKFLSLYRDNAIDISKGISGDNVLDKWIISRMANTSKEVNGYLVSFDVTKAARSINKFVDDLSRWYIRRSRKRLQNPETDKDFEDVSIVLARSLLFLSKVLAPFMPFFSEALYRSFDGFIKGIDMKESVHLEEWPELDDDIIDKELMDNMESIRDLASAVLSQREKEGIKVRQPLSLLKINKAKYQEIGEELLNTLKEEVNVKEVDFDDNIDGIMELNTEITDSLKEEGMIRELARSIQRLRAKAGLEPGDNIILGLEPDKDATSVIEGHIELLKDSVGAKEIVLSSVEGSEVNEEMKILESKVKVTFVKE